MEDTAQSESANAPSGSPGEVHALTERVAELEAAVEERRREGTRREKVVESRLRVLRSNLEDVQTRARRLAEERDQLKSEVQQQRNKLSAYARQLDENPVTDTVEPVFRPEDTVRRAEAAERALAGAHDQIDQLTQRVRELERASGAPPLDPEQPVRLPGEAEQQRARERMETGIPIDRETGAGLRELADELGVPFSLEPVPIETD